MVVAPIFLDIEASSLDSKSYPIEIAWSDHYGNIESYLINPYHVVSWLDWDMHAQKIHGINRKLLREEGTEPRLVCDYMSKSIKDGTTIYADGGVFDQNWINVLFAEGTELGVATFIVEHSDSVMLPLLTKIESDSRKRWQLYEELKVEARRMVNGQHRAKVDVEYLVELYKMCISISSLI